MAIWDKKPSKTELSADARKCLSCGDNLRYDPEEERLICNYCGSKYYPDVFEINQILEDRVEHTIDFEKAKLDEVARFSLEKRHEIICNSCGSTVVAGHNTISTFCAFCGSPAIVERRIQKEFLPDVIIPFKVTREDAEKKIRTWAKTQTVAPKDFMSQATFGKMTALYVPFWLVDAECDMNVSGQCYRDRVDGNLDEFQVIRKGHFPMRLVPFDGSNKINDRLMEAIEPFDYSELVDFNDSYLSGYYAERYDQSPSDLATRISNRFRDYMYNAAIEMTDNEDYRIRNLKNNYSTVSGYKCYYALLPVWFINCKYKGSTYNIALNGQTGEVAGQAPQSGWMKTLYSLKHGVTWLSLIVAGLLLLALIGGIYFYKTVGGLIRVYVTLLIPAIITIVACFVQAPRLRTWALQRVGESIGSKKKKKTTTLEERLSMDKMPDPYTYIDKSGISDVVRNDDYLGVTILNDDNRRRGFSF